MGGDGGVESKGGIEYMHDTHSILGQCCNYASRQAYGDCKYCGRKRPKPVSQFLESVHKLIDGPVLPYHLDRHPTLSGKWCVKKDVDGELVFFADRFKGAEKAGFTIKEAECMRDELNQKFREERAGS